MLVGEMRDLETIALTLTLAETGHLVFATLHTNDAAQTVDRIIDVFPSDQQDQIRVQFSMALAAVISQRLIPRVGGGRVAAYEVLLGTSAVTNIIREGKIRQLRNLLATGQKDGMMVMEQSLASLVHTQVITYEDAVAASVYPDEIAGFASHVTTDPDIPPPAHFKLGAAGNGSQPAPPPAVTGCAAAASASCGARSGRLSGPELVLADLRASSASWPSARSPTWSSTGCRFTSTSPTSAVRSGTAVRGPRSSAGRSRCSDCGAGVRPIDNIPIVSWLVLRGRCRSCGARIPAFHPLVELAVPLLFLGAVWSLGLTWAILPALWLIPVGVAVSVIDLRTLIVPTRIVWPAFFVMVGLCVVSAGLEGEWNRLASAAIGLLALAGPLFAIWFAIPHGMGFGDVRLATLLGFTIGFYAEGALLGAAFLSMLCLAGSAVLGILLGVIALGARGRGAKVPFGPSLVAGAFLCIAFAEPISRNHRVLTGIGSAGMGWYTMQLRRPAAMSNTTRLSLSSL